MYIHTVNDIEVLFSGNVNVIWAMPLLSNVYDVLAILSVSHLEPGATNSLSVESITGEPSRLAT